jgi:hypothetical protein
MRHLALLVTLVALGCYHDPQPQPAYGGYAYGPSYNGYYVQPQPPPPPPPQPQASGDGGVAWALVRYNIDQVNAYRARGGVPALAYDQNITIFAYQGSVQLSRDHAPHAHFMQSGRGAPGMGSARAENQGDPGGVPPMSSDAFQNGQKQIDIMLRMMMDEGPGGGHYDNMMNREYRRIGIGLYTAGGKLYLTNDFSN